MEKPDPVSTTIDVMRRLGLNPDPWQLDVLQGNHQPPAIELLPPGRQIHHRRHPRPVPRHLRQRLARAAPVGQSPPVRRTVAHGHSLLRTAAAPCASVSAKALTLVNGSRIISLPCEDTTIRGYANVGLLIIDEASRVPEDLYKACRPMLAVSNGRLICMSTPNGKRGFFYDAWTRGGDDWHRIEIAYHEVPRIKADFIAERTPQPHRRRIPAGIRVLLRERQGPGLRRHVQVCRLRNPLPDRRQEWEVSALRRLRPQVFWRDRLRLSRPVRRHLGRARSRRRPLALRRSVRARHISAGTSAARCRAT